MKIVIQKFSRFAGLSRAGGATASASSQRPARWETKQEGSTAEQAHFADGLDSPRTARAGPESPLPAQKRCFPKKGSSLQVLGWEVVGHRPGKPSSKEREEGAGRGGGIADWMPLKVRKQPTRSPGDLNVASAGLNELRGEGEAEQAHFANGLDSPRTARAGPESPFPAQKRCFPGKGSSLQVLGWEVVGHRPGKPSSKEREEGAGRGGGVADWLPLKARKQSTRSPGDLHVASAGLDEIRGEGETELSIPQLPSSFEVMAKVSHFRKVEFNQVTYFSSLGGGLPEAIAEKKAGLCSGLTYAWIAIRQQAPKASAQEVMNALADSKNPVGVVASGEYRAAVHEFNRGNSEYHSVGNGWLDTSALLPANKPNPIMEDWNARSLAQAITKTEGSQTITTRVSAGTTPDNCANLPGHVVGVHNPGGGQNIEFFDSNHGHYSIPPEHLEHFLRTVEEAQTNHERNTSKLPYVRLEVSVNPMRIDTEAIPNDVRLRLGLLTTDDSDLLKALAPVALLTEWTDNLGRTHANMQTLLIKGSIEDSQAASNGKRSPDRPSDTRWSPAKPEDWLDAAEAITKCAWLVEASRSNLAGLESRPPNGPDSPDASKRDRLLQPARASFERDERTVTEFLGQLAPSYPYLLEKLTSLEKSEQGPIADKCRELIPSMKMVIDGKSFVGASPSPQ